MKILVAYYSRTGNTKKIAESIYQALEGERADIRPMGEIVSVDDYSLIFCGFPVEAHSVPLPAQSFLKSIGKEKKVALFSTHGSVKGGQMPREAIKSAAGIVQAEIIGSFTCKGEVGRDVIDQMMKSAQHCAWAREAESAKSHPDSADRDDAAFFAKSILKKIRGFNE